jgi:adenosylmethionine-8-amino-7-oxononanoate aminotransferase
VQYLDIFLILIYFSETKTSAILHRDTRFVPKKAIGGKGCYVFLEDGTKFLDATGGAAVSCLGHGNEQVTQIIKDQMDQISYCHSAFFGTQVAEDLAKLLVDSTGGKLSKVFITSSGERRQPFHEPKIQFTRTVLTIYRVGGCRSCN